MIMQSLVLGPYRGWCFNFFSMAAIDCHDTEQGRLSVLESESKKRVGWVVLQSLHPGGIPFFLPVKSAHCWQAMCMFPPEGVPEGGV